MNQTEIEDLFNDSYERLSDWVAGAESGSRDAFFLRFYERFIAKSPEIARAFRDTDMRQQIAVLEKSIVYLVNYYATNNVHDFMRRVALRHAKGDLDIAPELYDLWLEALVETVRECDPRSNADTEEAWRIVLSPGIAFMKSYYNPH